MRLLKKWHLANLSTTVAFGKINEHDVNTGTIYSFEDDGVINTATGKYKLGYIDEMYLKTTSGNLRYILNEFSRTRQ